VKLPILPAERLRMHSVWLRLVIVSALRALYKPGGIRRTMLIDEMAALGHLAPLEDAFGLVRGYNIQIAAILQDLSQLKALYKERWETFIANAGVVCGFAPNDLTTAEWMSKRSGQTTVAVQGVSRSAGTTDAKDTSESRSAGASIQQMARPVLLPHELIGLGEGMAVMWLAGLSDTTPCFFPYYKKIALCRERAAPEPD
jgi:type IV secretion system protein VirD4